MHHLRSYLYLYLAIISLTVISNSNACPEATEPDTKGLTIELISEVTSIAPGKPFHVGLRIKHDLGFHTYWKNPGVVGVPTHIKWTLPPGFKASEIKWPHPENSKMADYPCFGYERDVLLTIEITPPTKLTTNNITLIANTNWMCCSSNCYPGFKKFSLTLPKGTGENNNLHTTSFNKSLASIPQPTNKIQAKLISAKDAQNIKVIITTSDNIEPLYIFNSDGQTTPDLPFSLTKKDHSTHIFQAKRSKFGIKSSTSFPFILQTTTNFYEIIAK